MPASSESPLEKEIERKIVFHCKARGLLCYKFVSPANSGVPDRTILGQGKALYLEVKRRGKQPTALQLREIARINKVGGAVAANWCDSIEQARLIIDEHFFI
jgi:hypothetical protein